MQAHIQELVARLRQAREGQGLNTDDVEDLLILGRGWVERVEAGLEQPPLDLLWAMAQVVEVDLAALMTGLPVPETPMFERVLTGVREDDGVVFYFPFGKYTAHYKIDGATKEQVDEVLAVLRTGLARTETAEAIEQEVVLVDDEGDADPAAAPAAAEKARVVARTFLKATEVWPHVNPSDLWYFIIAKAFLDPYNHPAALAHGDLGQSWKRTGGWALEYIFLDYYSPILAKHGIFLLMPSQERKRDLISRMGLGNEVNPDKADLLFVYQRPNGKEECFGVGHVKASFAERRTDDVPLSEALIRRGYLSPLLTMDCKGTPQVKAYNKGELGPVQDPDKPKIKVSEKRLDIERDKKFDACFTYNANTLPTPDDIPASARVISCDFQNPDDAFVAHVIEFWKRRYNR